MSFDPLTIIYEFYSPDSKLCQILIRHGQLVAEKALEIAKRVSHLNPDIEFIEQASVLHDIGIYLTKATEIGCTGPYPYICHGYLGRNLLEAKGLPRHALVCERHVGAGITISDIQSRNLPLPHRDMLPISIEEQIICYADKFYSKHPSGNDHEKSIDQIIISLAKHGNDSVQRFLNWHKIFTDNNQPS